MENKSELKLEVWVSPQIEELSVNSDTLGGHDNFSDDVAFDNS
jgi:hypothetical protein